MNALALILLLVLWSLVAVAMMRVFAAAARCDQIMKDVPGPDHPGTARRTGRQNSAANSTDEHEGLAGPKRPKISHLDVRGAGSPDYAQNRKDRAARFGASAGEIETAQRIRVSDKP